MSSLEQHKRQITSWLLDSKECVTVKRVAFHFKISRTEARHLLYEILESNPNETFCVTFMTWDNLKLSLCHQVGEKVEKVGDIYAVGLDGAASLRSALEFDKLHTRSWYVNDLEAAIRIQTAEIQPVVMPIVRDKSQLLVGHQVPSSDNSEPAAVAKVPPKQTNRKTTSAAAFFGSAASNKSSSVTASAKGKENMCSQGDNTNKKKKGKRKKVLMDESSSEEEDANEEENACKKEKQEQHAHTIRSSTATAAKLKKQSNDKKTASGHQDDDAHAKDSANVDDFVGDDESDEDEEQEEASRLKRAAQELKDVEEKREKRSKASKAAAEKRRKRKMEKEEKQAQAANNNADDDENEPETKTFGAMDTFVTSVKSNSSNNNGGGSMPKRQRKKLVEKTTVDENGYMHTEMITVMEDIPSDEEVKDLGGTSSNSKPIVAKKNATNAKPQQKKKPAVKNTKGMKQSGLMSFFTKKS